jgi:hypothetical protein
LCDEDVRLYVEVSGFLILWYVDKGLCLLWNNEDMWIMISSMDEMSGIVPSG